MPVNEYGQMIGESMEGYTPGELPSINFLEGRYARIEALSVEKHAEDLLAVYGPDTPREMWTYLFQEPVADREELVRLLNQMLARKDRFFYAIVDKATGKALGTFSLMRIDQNNRVIEVVLQSTHVAPVGMIGRRRSRNLVGVDCADSRIPPLFRGRRL